MEKMKRRVVMNLLAHSALTRVRHGCLRTSAGGEALFLCARALPSPIKKGFELLKTNAEGCRVLMNQNRRNENNINKRNPGTGQREFVGAIDRGAGTGTGTTVLERSVTIKFLASTLSCWTRCPDPACPLMQYTTKRRSRPIFLHPWEDIFPNPKLPHYPSPPIYDVFPYFSPRCRRLSPRQ